MVSQLDDRYAGAHIARFDWSPDTGFDSEVIDRAMRRLGRAVRLARRRNGWTQHHLAARSGIDQGTISRLERGLLHGLSLWRLAVLFQVLDGILVER